MAPHHSSPQRCSHGRPLQSGRGHRRRKHLGDAGLQFVGACSTPADVDERRAELHVIAHGLSDGVVTRDRLVALAANASDAASALDAPSDREHAGQARAAARLDEQKARELAEHDRALVRQRAQASPARQHRLVVAALEFMEQQLVVSKATQAVVDVQTQLGTVQYRVPAGKRELEQSPQRENWLEADRKALHAILSGPGNRLVPVTKPASLGKPIARTVTTRKMKVDQATGELAKNNAFKSRHALDGGYLQVQQSQLSKLGDASGNATAVEADVPSSATIADDMLCKLFLADAAMRDRSLTKGDVGDAYAKGERLRSPGYMALPSTLPMRDEDGTPLCIELATPMWGEGPAGYEWQRTFNEALLELGWRQAECVPAMFSINVDGKDAHMLTVVDDFLISESGGHEIADRTIAALRQRFGEVKAEHEPDSFVGYKIQRDRLARTLTISMPQKIVEAARAHAPALIEGAALDAPKGKKLVDLADGMQLAPREPGQTLSKRQTTTQQLIGSLKFIEKIMPRLSLPLHRLSCVMSSPPPEALDVALGVLAAAYKTRDTGITFGGAAHSPDGARLQGQLSSNLLDEPAPGALEASADATWGDRIVYGLLVTYGHGAVAHGTKKIGMILDSSMEAEAIGSSKAGETVTYAREILRALGVPCQHPTVVMTDNKANLQVARDLSSASRSRHFLRRYWALQQRMHRGEVRLVKIDDPNMPADFLTKWLQSAKLARSVRYATNARAAE